ncbi:MAG TPA: DUF2975 domain-containing protein [Caulobacteraceae bacterium]|nr:DUF2975 domain-containing protein [Caulobacteraceae bacterium]
MFRALGPGSVSSFLKVILDVFNYVLWVFAVLFAVGILGLLLVSFDTAILPAPIAAEVRVMGHGPGPVAALMLAGAELYLIGVLVIVQRLRRVFGTMTAGDPFHPDNVRRLRVVGLVLALLEIDRYLFGAIDRFILHERPFAGDGVNLTAWFAVLVVIVLAEVFREGARLRRDSELTI